MQQTSPVTAGVDESARWWPLERLLALFRPGSRDAPWGWEDEHDDLWFSPDQRDLTCSLAHLILRDGQQDPVLLGDDGRIWDGHHRVVIAMRYGIPQVLVTYEDTPPPCVNPQG